MRKYLLFTALAIGTAAATVLVGLRTLPRMARAQQTPIDVGASRNRCTLEYQFTELFSRLPAEQLPATPFPNRVALAKYISENEAELGNLAEAIYGAINTNIEATKACFYQRSRNHRYKQNLLFSVKSNRDGATISRGRLIEAPGETISSRPLTAPPPPPPTELRQIASRCFDDYFPTSQMNLTAFAGKPFPVYDGHIPWRVSFLHMRPAEAAGTTARTDMSPGRHDEGMAR